MALLIPALEWSSLSIVGDTTSGDLNVINIANTTAIEAGMVVYGAGIQYNSRVVSKSATTIVLDKTATVTATGVALTLYKRYDFQYPPTRDEGEQYSANQTITTSLAGVRQTTTNFIEAKRRLTFGFVSKVDRDELRDDFYETWLILGKSFRYFEDQDVNTVITYENDTKNYSQKRQVKKHPDFLYEIDFQFRRVI